MNDVERNLFSIVQTNRDNLNCLVDVYQLLNLDFEDPKFMCGYQAILVKYSYEIDSLEELLTAIKKVIIQDKKAFEGLSHILYEKPIVNSLLTFYIPYLMWDLVDVNQFNLSKDKARIKMKNISR